MDYSRAGIPTTAGAPDSIAVANSRYVPHGPPCSVVLWLQGGLGSALPVLLPPPCITAGEVWASRCQSPSMFALLSKDNHTCKADDGVSRKGDRSLVKLWNVLRPALK